MSELIGNRKEKQEILKEIIKELHAGRNKDEVKARFASLIKNIAPSEISEMEQALISEGMPVSEIQRLCDIHADIFKGSIEEIHREKRPEEDEGHPVFTLKLENRQMEKHLDESLIPHLEAYLKSKSGMDKSRLMDAVRKTETIDRHYSRKENLIFPIMEAHGITAPPKVMWGVDDEIRHDIKKIRSLLEGKAEDISLLDVKTRETVNKIKEMIFKEENILIPMTLDTFTRDEWARIAEAGDEIGYTLLKDVGKWEKTDENVKQTETYDERHISFSAGSLTSEEADCILNTIPFDMTFVDSDDRVKYFTQGRERIFARPKTIIGREVRNCHPPASVHVVERIIDSFRKGEKDHEDFWIKMGSKYVYIRYFAVRNENGKYLGTLEVTQDIGPIKELKGEKRIMDS